MKEEQKVWQWVTTSLVIVALILIGFMVFSNSPKRIHWETPNEWCEKHGGKVFTIPGGLFSPSGSNCVFPPK